jgi:hypothetical protein
MFMLLQSHGRISQSFTLYSLPENFKCEKDSKSHVIFLYALSQKRMWCPQKKDTAYICHSPLIQIKEAYKCVRMCYSVHVLREAA